MFEEVVCGVKIYKKQKSPSFTGEGGSVVMSFVYFLLEEVVSVLLSSFVFATLPLPCLTTVSFEAEFPELLRDAAAGAGVSDLLDLEDSAFAPDCEEGAGLETEVSVDLLPAAEFCPSDEPVLVRGFAVAAGLLSLELLLPEPVVALSLSGSLVDLDLWVPVVAG